MKKKKNKVAETSERWLDRMRKKSRIAISDLDSFEVKRHFLLSGWNVLWGGLFGLIIIVALTWAAIAYTPLKQSIPGYPKLAEVEKIKRTDLENIKMLAELEAKQNAVEQYNKTLLEILNEQNPTDPTLGMDSAKALDSSVINKISFATSEEDSLLRLKVAANEKYGFTLSKTIKGNASDNIAGVYFFPPLKGEVSQNIEPKKGHFGIDIQAPKDEAVKSTLDGTVIYTDWSPENGHVVHVQHNHNLVSVYKHNSFLLKKQGDKVKSGEPIAIIGNSGSLSLGTHLHFELWYNGVPMNPLQFITFK